MSLFSLVITELTAELALFAAVGYLLFAVDDLVVDLIYFIRRGWRAAMIYSHHPKMFAGDLPAPMRPGWMAIFIPAWDEANVIAPMLRATLERFGAGDYRLFVGHYRNDPATRAAILSIPKGQWEAAQTIGMNYPTTLRRVILPQAARTAVPPLSNTLISLVKDTSLASTILVTELLRVAQLAAAPTFDFFALYAVAAVYYWVICEVLSLLQGRLETRLGRYVAR